MALPLPTLNSMREFFRRNKEDIPPGLKRAMAMLKLKDLGELEERFLGIEPFLAPWGTYRDQFLLIKPASLSEMVEITRADISWAYTHFDENARRHDSREDGPGEDYEMGEKGFIDKSRWGQFEFERHLYVWLLQNFQVGKRYNPWDFACMELASTGKIWETVLLPIVTAVRASYSPKGRRHYGRLALYIEEKFPSRLAFPEGNVPLPPGRIFSSIPYRVVSKANTFRENGVTEKEYDETERELRDVYPLYGGLVERPKFPLKMDEWLSEQRERARIRKEVPLVNPNEQVSQSLSTPSTPNILRRASQKLRSSSAKMTQRVSSLIANSTTGSPKVQNEDLTCSHSPQTPRSVTAPQSSASPVSPRSPTGVHHISSRQGLRTIAQMDYLAEEPDMPEYPSNIPRKVSFPSSKTSETRKASNHRSISELPVGPMHSVMSGPSDVSTSNSNIVRRNERYYSTSARTNERGEVNLPPLPADPEHRPFASPITSTYQSQIYTPTTGRFQQTASSTADPSSLKNRALIPLPPPSKLYPNLENLQTWEQEKSGGPSCLVRNESMQSRYKNRESPSPPRKVASMTSGSYKGKDRAVETRESRTPSKKMIAGQSSYNTFEEDDISMSELGFTSTPEKDKTSSSFATTSMAPSFNFYDPSRDSVYGAISKMNPYDSEVTPQVITVPASYNLASIDSTFSPMGAPSAVPCPLFNEKIRRTDSNKASAEQRPPSYEGSGYQDEISPASLSTTRSAIAKPTGATSKGKGKAAAQASRIPTPIRIQPVPYSGNLTAEASDAPPLDDGWTVVGPAPSIPPKSPLRWASPRGHVNPTMARVAGETTEQQAVARIVSKENIRAVLGGNSPDTSVEDVSMLARSASSPAPKKKQVLQTYNTHMFPRKEWN